MNELEHYGIYLSMSLGFAFANFLSWFLLDDFFVRKLCILRFKKLVECNKNQTLQEVEIKANEFNSNLDLDFGKDIGRIERIFYIYGVMFGQFSLISAWIILKAFFGWIQKPDVAQSGAPKEVKAITTFHAYIYGNALSLLGALALGHIGLVIAKLVQYKFNLP